MKPIKYFAQSLDKARMVFENLRPLVPTAMVAASNRADEDYVLVARADGLMVGSSQRAVIRILYEAGYRHAQGTEKDELTRVIFDIAGVRIAVWWPEEKED